MNVDRRDVLSGLLGTAAFSALHPNLRAAEVLAHATPSNLASDPLRPQFHLLPAANWMNDPNGPIYWQGHYHMFYQYNPNGAFWGDMNWGHATSADMVYWRHLPVALSPTPGGPDADGCFTGTAVVQDGKVVVLYTGVHAAQPEQATIIDGAHCLRETQCYATSDDPELKTWTKLSTPVIAAPPEGKQVNGFRDPSPWRQGDLWYMVLGSGVANQGGAVLLYKSKDLRSWEFMHVLAGRNQVGVNPSEPYDPWEVWECPEFFALGDKHVLICSTLGKAYWQSGLLNQETMRFRPEQSGILDYGAFYAPKTQLDKSGNRILWGWIQETRPLKEYKTAGWAGSMSLPRVLSLSSDGQLRCDVSTVVDTLRGREQALNVTADEEKNLLQISSMRITDCRGEIACSVKRPATPFELLLCGPDENQASWLRLRYDPLHISQFFIDARPHPFRLNDDEKIDLHLFIDGSVIELFVNQKIAHTSRFYYPGGKAQDLRMKWTGKTTDIVSLRAWELSAISGDRLTT